MNDSAVLTTRGNHSVFKVQAMVMSKMRRHNDHGATAKKVRNVRMTRTSVGMQIRNQSHIPQNYQFISGLLYYKSYK